MYFKMNQFVVDAYIDCKCKREKISIKLNKW